MNPNDSSTHDTETIIIDDIISYLITTYKSDCFYNIDVSKIINEIDRSLYHSIQQIIYK
jgi:hypothetical protein